MPKPKNPLPPPKTPLETWLRKNPTLQLGPHAFKVEFLEVIVSPDGEICTGRIQQDLRVITLQSGLSNSVLLETLFHEIMHFLVWAHVSLSLGEHEEAVVNAMGNGLASLVHYNPGLFKAIGTYVEPTNPVRRNAGQKSSSKTNRAGGRPRKASLSNPLP